MFSSAVRRYVCHGTFDNLEQRLLNALAADVASDGGVLGFSADFINLIAAAAKAAKTKAEAPAEVKAETKVNFVVEFNNKQNSAEDIINNVKATYGKDAKEISIYLKPDENKAYFVADGEEGSMDVFFC